MIYLSIPALAVGTFDAAAYGLGFIHGTTSSSAYWKPVTNNSKIMIGDYTGSMYDCFIAFKTNQIIQDGYIIVATVTFDNTNSDYVNFVGAGQVNSNTIPGNYVSYSSLLNLSYNQNIIAVTKNDDKNQCTVTVTYKAQGYINQYPILFYEVRKANSNEAIYASTLDLYETIEDAAGSSVTPEEMREVLNSWGEEELIPGIGQAVGDKIEQVVPDAILDGMDKHDDKLKTEGGSVIENIKDQISETITPYFENTDQIRDAIHGGASGIFGYAGTDAVITLPAARNPLTGNSLMWNEYQIDLGMYYNRLPAALRQLISALLTLLVSIGVIRELLDTVNTILIHREILGMPDDVLKSWTRRDG